MEVGDGVGRRWVHAVAGEVIQTWLFVECLHSVGKYIGAGEVTDGVFFWLSRRHGQGAAGRLQSIRSLRRRGRGFQIPNQL